MHHRVSRALSACVLLLAALSGAAGRAETIQDRFGTVWESLWFQGGSPQRVIRWPGDIHVRLIGQSVSFHRTRVFKALELVAGISGRKVIDVSGADDAETRAQLTVEVVGDRELEDNMACLVRFDSVQGADITKATLKMRHRSVYHCVLHEAMHAMGIPGHPSGDTVLSYFYQRVDALTELDGLLLRAWYSSEMKPGMSPLEALVVLTDHVVMASPGDAAAHRAAQGRFLDDTLRSMLAFAGEGGEVPVILKRSGKASGEVMRWGRTLMRFYLGLAYLRGTIVARDTGQSHAWFERAARDGLASAQMNLGYMHERGVGVPASAAEAYLWYSLAAAQGYEPGKAAAERLAGGLTPQQLADARDRLARFK